MSLNHNMKNRSVFNGQFNRFNKYVKNFSKS